MSFHILPSAAKHIETFSDGAMLRIQIKSGGCSGLKSVFLVETKEKSNDHKFQEGKAVVLIDPLSMSFLQNAQLDYVEEMMGAHFILRNPMAQSSCGCGESFSI